jgi:hypothetical protein
MSTGTENGSRSGSTYAEPPISKELTSAIAQSMVHAMRNDVSNVTKGVSVLEPAEQPSFKGFATNLDKLVDSSPELRRAVEETMARNVRRAMAFGDGPVPSTEEWLAAMRTPPVMTKGGSNVRWDWWGFQLKVSHEDLNVFLATAVPLTAITATLVIALAGPTAPFVAAVAAFIAGVLGLLKALDRGNGIYISMSWFAVGAFIPTTA